MEVKIVADIFLVDLNKVLVTFEVAEPANPAGSRLTVVIIVQLFYTTKSASTDRPRQEVTAATHKSYLHCCNDILYC
jgi:hypothetical protein